MKKFIIIMLALCLMLICSACTDNGETAKPEDTPNETEQPDESIEGEKEITVMYLYINENKLKVTLAENRAVTALIEILNQGDITYTAYANSFEIYGDIGHSLPTDNAQITSQAGDVLLWAGSNICIFFGNNSYPYTRLGKINGYSASELRTILSAGEENVQVRISLI